MVPMTKRRSKAGKSSLNREPNAIIKDNPMSEIPVNANIKPNVTKGEKRAISVA